MAAESVVRGLAWGPHGGLHELTESRFSAKYCIGLPGLLRIRMEGGMMKRTLMALLLCAASSIAVRAGEAAVKIPAPVVDDKRAAGGLQTAVIAGGCFWGVQGVYQHLNGVRKVLSGYSGGAKADADYQTVGGGNSGHAESVQIVYDPAKVTYGQILQVFFSVAHDPTQLDRQGPDTGPQYRSAIFYANAGQQKIARAYIAQLNAAKVYPAAIVTRLDPLKGFYAAEAYHQDFLVNHPAHPYIVVNDLPKVRNFERLFPAMYGARAVTVASAK
jgi:peptide-methionine (S)-S-oxide reductase